MRSRKIMQFMCKWYIFIYFTCYPSFIKIHFSNSRWFPKTKIFNIIYWAFSRSLLRLNRLDSQTDTDPVYSVTLTFVISQDSTAGVEQNFKRFLRFWKSVTLQKLKTIDWCKLILLNRFWILTVWSFTASFFLDF